MIQSRTHIANELGSATLARRESHWSGWFENFHEKSQQE